MATNRWIGAAPVVAQLDTYTPASVTVGNTFTITSGNSTTVTFTATATTAANVTAGLFALASASTAPPEFADVTWTDNTGTLTAVAKIPGKPFTFTSSAAVGGGSGTPTLSRAATTASSGPNDVGVAANWSLGVPVTTQDLVLAGSSTSLLWGLDQSGISGTIASVTVAPDFTGQIGLPITSSGGYPEYRSTYWKINATTLTLAGTGSRQRINVGGTTTTATVNNTGSSADSGLECLLLLGTVLTLIVYKGSVGVAVQSGESATLASLKTAFISNQLTDAKVRLGTGCATLPSLILDGGQVQTYQTVTLGTLNAGTLTANAAVTTANNRRATMVYRTSATLGTYLGFGHDTLDMRQGPSRTVTTCTVNAGSTILDPFRRTTWTNGVVLNDCGNSDVSIDFGDNISLQVTNL